MTDGEGLGAGMEHGGANVLMSRVSQNEYVETLSLPMAWDLGAEDALPQAEKKNTWSEEAKAEPSPATSSPAISAGCTGALSP